ncbi:hypothetical protein HDK77DRAFT_425913 [Phyllosticta capitalensis]|uniref:Deoxyribonuclease NucA/NucB domain-containing protein n=1 Tax=Phyllosticta capitalensis TaxID=121624 RepID=A0ABR1YXC8_9PEZI
MRLSVAAALLGSAGAVIATSHALNRRTPPGGGGNNPDDLMIFLCNETPEICKNMCYGAYCQYIGERLRYDKPESAEMRRRSQAAGCGTPEQDRCAQLNPPLECDQYPFTSTVSTTDRPDRVSRCVPGDQNTKQSSIINAFYKSTYCGGGPCEFSVSFSNPGGVRYCEAYFERTDCDTKAGDRSEDIQVVGPGDDKIPKSEDAGSGIGEPPDGPEQKVRARGDEKAPPATQFKTDTGLEIFVPGGAFIGQRAFIVIALNVSLWDEQIQNHQRSLELAIDEFDYMLDNLQVIELTVSEEIG